MRVHPGKWLASAAAQDRNQSLKKSGTLRLLRARVVEEKPDVVHISCHGRLTPQPALLLEDEFGNRSPTSAQNLLKGLAGQRPRLLFLSACQMAMTDDVVSSLVWSLVQSAAPAVIGRAGSVRDHEAAEFARFLYRRLAEGEPLINNSRRLSMRVSICYRPSLATL